MRFDDSLSTVLAADTTSAFGAQSAFRQLVDLLGRGRAPATPALIQRLEELRAHVPAAVRAASARGLALARPSAALVGFFAEDDPGIAAPVLRVADLAGEEWIALLPRLGPTGRAVLRGRQDLAAEVVRALDSFGATDFTIGYDRRVAEASAVEVQPAAIVMAEGPTQSEAALTHGFPIAELVDRIAAFQRERPAPAPLPARATAFAFETDGHGRIGWTDVAERGSLAGLTLAGDLGAAVRSCRPIRGARLSIAAGALAGEWRVAGDPLFDGDGRYLGLRCAANRLDPPEASNGEAIRRLVHELRTPMNAISGFAELMGSELLGPVPPAHRAAATAIHAEMAALLGAIEDLDTAARIEGGALELAPHEVALWPLLAEAARAAGVSLHGDRDAIVAADARVLARLAERFVGLVGEGGTIELRFDGSWSVAAAERAALAATPLLGADFTQRLVADLARELGGALETTPRLTLRLPGRLTGDMRLGGRM